ncbi:unnamed protein product [Closterium sp. NIES-53]
MDVWGPARVTRQHGERYFLLVVDDYMRYTTVFPLQSKADVRVVLIRWICAVRLQLRAQFRQDLPVLLLHSHWGGEFCARLLKDFCGAEGIVDSYMLPASPRQNGIVERRIGLVMEVARTSMIHAAAPHFLLPFVVRYAAVQLNLWPCVTHPETFPSLRWTGKVGDASAFLVWGSLSLVRDLPAGKLSPHTLWCVFLGFPTDAPPWQFYHPSFRRVLSSRDVTFDDSVCFYCLHSHCSSPVPLPPLSLVAHPPPPIAPLPPPGPAPLGVSHIDPPLLVEPLQVSSDTSGPAEEDDPTAVETVAPRRSARLAVPPGFPPRPSSPPLQPVAVDSGAAGGGDTGDADCRGAGSGGAASPTGADSHGRRDGILEAHRHLLYGLRQAPREWHDTLSTTLAALGFAPLTVDPSLFLRTDTSLPPFYVLVSFSASTSRGPHHSPLPCLPATRPQLLPSDESVEPSGMYPELVGCLVYLMTCTRPDLAYPLSLLARYVAPDRHQKAHWEAAARVLRYLCSTLGMGLVLVGRGSVVLTSHSDASWADDQTTHRSTQGYSFSLSTGSVSWRSTRSSSAQELRWLTYLLNDLGEWLCSPPILYVDNKAMIALCQDQRLEHRMKHIALRYFLMQELQQRGQLCLAYVATQANTVNDFTKALGSSDHQRFCTNLGLVPTLPHLIVS